jgi:hypothetical protein
MGDSSMTKLTKGRRALLEQAFRCWQHGSMESLPGNPDWRHGIKTHTPKRKPAWADEVGRACWSLRDWTFSGFPQPMQTTIAELHRALGKELSA